MPRGYDAQANEAWEQAKVLAEKENRPLTLSDLWWGIWATIPTENLAVALPETIQHRLKELRGKQAVGKVKVSEEVKRSSPMDVMGEMVVRQLARHLGEAVVGQETALQILEQAVMTALATVFVVPSGVMRMTTRTKAIWRLASRHPCHATIGQWRMAH
jgi:ATP-dependent Clp protease ATP-binding subunit ClpA